MQKKGRYLWIACALALVMFTGCATTPYRSKFQCPAGYPGLCEPIEQAYKDSTHNLDPRLYDERWVKKEIEWEKKNAALIEARKRAGEDIKTVRERLEELKKRGSRKDETYLYRKKLFTELKELLSEPEKPVVVPPKVIRVLVLSTLAKEPDGREIFISPRYIYFMLDRPRWLLHEEAEKIPFDSKNPLVRVPDKGK